MENYQISFIKLSKFYDIEKFNYNASFRQNSINTHTAPSVEVKNPKVHITLEASIDSFDSKQLQTLMSKGLKEDKVVKLIIEGFLN
ncbi:MAG: hypothetical protein E3J77_03470 [Actinobacteria bacterium]|nr:hypothetical protein [Clostridia bacterium]TET14902.1 MAG: hypothetical protein E3J77_03470 [Actinomycetota bacterium]